MISCFTLGFVAFSLLKKKEPSPKKISHDLPALKDSLALKILLALVAIAVILNLIDLAIGLRYILSGTPAWQVRNWSLEPFGSDNPILGRRSFVEDVARVILLSPASALMAPVAAYYFFGSKEKKTRNILAAVSVVNLVTSSLAGGGGRLGYILFAVYYLLAYNHLKHTGSLRKKFNTKKLLVAACVCGVFVLGFTIIRTGFGNLFKQFSTYFGMPPALLAKWLPFIGGGAGFTFGLTTLFGLHSYGFRALKTIGLGAAVPAIYNVAFYNILSAEKFVPMGNGMNYNAFVTPVYYFFADGGLIGVILFSLVFGIICSLLYSSFRKTGDLKHFLLYSLMVYAILISFMRIQTAIPSFIISILFVLLLFNKKLFVRKYK